MNRTRKRLLRNARISHAFTLAELIVVVTILAVLTMVGFLSLSRYSSDAKEAAVKTNVQTVIAAIYMESTKNWDSPRKYVIHDYSASGSALSGAVVMIDGNSFTLSGGDWNVPGTNYTA
jgi:prepilin-type N-terminal cleavage/methylation domain-containing protein